MVAGLKFLSKKSFNPQNLTNQKSVWEREQESKREEDRHRRRAKQLTIERDHEELARSREGASGGQRAALRFMYDAPPGLGKDKDKQHNGYEDDDDDILGRGSISKKEKTSMPEEDGNLSLERKAGDDDAAAAFRAMLASGVAANSMSEEQAHGNGNQGGNDNTTAASSLIISGSTAEANDNIDHSKSQLTQLEKAVGKRNSTSALTYEEQIARFPQLKNAPIVLKRNKGGDGDDEQEVSKTNLNFKPLGAQIRNVRCMSCKVWGHSKGDRECQLSGWDPFAIQKPAAANATSSSIMTGVCKSTSANSTSIDNGASGSSYYGPSGDKKDSSKKDRDRRKKRKKHDSYSDSSDDSDSDDSSEREYRSRRRRHKKSKRRRRDRRDRKERKRRKNGYSSVRTYDRDDKDGSYDRDDYSHGSDKERSRTSKYAESRKREKKSSSRRHDTNSSGRSRKRHHEYRSVRGRSRSWSSTSSR